MPLSIRNNTEQVLRFFDVNTQLGNAIANNTTIDGLPITILRVQMGAFGYDKTEGDFVARPNAMYVVTSLPIGTILFTENGCNNDTALFNPAN